MTEPIEASNPAPTAGTNPQLTPAVDAHALEAAEVERVLDVDPGVGLAEAEAARRGAAAGPNVLEEGEHATLLKMIIEAATEPFILLLLAAGIVAILVGEVRDGILVLLGTIPIIAADVITEYRGERAMEALRAATAPTARVRRDGEAREIPAAALVPGDVVLLRGGDVVPADLRLTLADRILVDTSVLTGESVPELASISPDAPDAPVAARRSMAFAGTSVVSGRGEGIVTAIGHATEFGRIASNLARRERRRSPLQNEMARLVRILLVVAGVLVALTMGLAALRGATLGEIVLAGVAAAIASIPEEPPVLLAVALGLGAYRLLKRGVLVRRLNAEETLGAVDFILTDKTGTLTQNRLAVASVRTPDGASTESAARARLIEQALRAEEDAWQIGSGGRPGSFTRALLAERPADAPALDRVDLLAGEPARDGTPFSRTIARADADGATSEELVLGAPEAVLVLCASTGAADDALAPWHRLADESAATGERLVLLAGRTGVPGEPGTWREPAAPLEPRALVGFADPLRPGIAEAFTTARTAGIQAIVVTGDHPLTASAIARQAGLEASGVITGSELDSWDDARLARELPGLHVVARAVPEQKLRIVKLARSLGRTVAVTGDGVNDAPALNSADVAVAMGSGTAVAKEASDLVLGDDSFATLMFGLREGRRIVDNVQKGLVFLLSTHMALLGYIFVATLAGSTQPLLPIQILWLELFIDIAASVAFEREPEEPGIMSRPPLPRGKPLVDGGILAGLAGAGGFSALAALAITLLLPGSDDHLRWLAYTGLVVGQAVRAWANRSLLAPVWRLGVNRFLLGAVLLSIAIQAAIPYIPFVNGAFRAEPLDLVDWGLVAAMALAPAVLAQLARLVVRRRWVA